MEATAKDLRFHAKELLETVSRGEEVIITYRGKPCARLVPYSNDPTTEKGGERDELFGIWRDHDEVQDVKEYIRNLRKDSY